MRSRGAGLGGRHAQAAEQRIARGQQEPTHQRRMREARRAFRILTPVRRRDHTGDVYSLNRNFLEEFLVYPFSAHDDMLDCCSRIYDIEATPPILIAEDELEPECFADGV